MHEFAICESLVEALLAEMGKLRPPPRRLVKARVVVGVLRQVVPEYLREAYALLTHDTAAAGSALEIRVQPLVGRCRSCGWEGGLSPSDILCASCGKGDLEIVAGRELYLESLEVEFADETAAQ